MKFFWATPDMVLAARASSAPLLLDATYNSTKSVLKLVVPCTVGPDNTTTVIGVAMIFQEDVQTWNWILAKLKQVCGFNGESPQTWPPPRPERLPAGESRATARAAASTPPDRSHPLRPGGSNAG